MYLYYREKPRLPQIWRCPSKSEFVHLGPLPRCTWCTCAGTTQLYIYIHRVYVYKYILSERECLNVTKFSKQASTVWGSIAQFKERYPQLGRLSWATAHLFCLSALTILRLMCTTAVQSVYAFITRCLNSGLLFILSNQRLTRMNSSGSSSKRGHSTFVMLRDHAGLGWSQKWLQIYICV